MASPKTPPRRAVLIAARLITAVVSLAGAEGMLWFMNYPNWWAMDQGTGGGMAGVECDPQLGWKLKEGDYKLVWAEHPDPNHPFRYTNWSQGRRATAEQEPALDIHRRPEVMFFGDSYVQGYGLSNEDTLPWIVQRRHPELEVSNFGTGLYGTYQSYLAIEQRVHAPAHVYYQLSSFHEGRNAGEPSFLRIMKKPPAGCFYPYAELANGEIEDRRSPGELVWLLSRHLRTVAMIEDYKLIFESHWRMKDKRKLTEALLVKMNDAVHAAGGAFTVIVFQMDPQERKDYRQFLESHKIALINCDHPEMSDAKLRLPDGHPNGKLNELLAQWIEPLPAVRPQVAAGNFPEHIQ